MSWENYCQIEYCIKKRTGAHRYCKRHHENEKLYSNPLPRKERPIEDLLRGMWNVNENDCWIWNGAINGNGYGMFSAKHLGIKKQRAHRVIFEYITNTEIGDAILLHSCDTPSCVNPSHLRTGTHKENMEDMVLKRRHWAHKRKFCKNGHNLTINGSVQQVVRKNGFIENNCVICTKERHTRHEIKLRKALGDN